MVEQCRALSAALGGLACVGIATGVAGSARAESVEEFYRGKTLNIVVGHEAGTGFDLYARTLSRFMSGYIPGAPGIIVQNMVGASGLNATNWLYNVAPKDGTVIATFAHTAPLEP